MAQPTGKKIVLADDEVFIAKAYNEGLTRAGYNVIVCKDGVDAFKKVQSEKPDLVLLDLIMPGMTGFEVLKNIKDAEDLKAIPVMILSNLSQDTDRAEAAKLGATEFLIKSDVSLSDVVDKVNEFFSK